MIVHAALLAVGVADGADRVGDDAPLLLGSRTNPQLRPAPVQRRQLEF